MRHRPPAGTESSTSSGDGVGPLVVYLVLLFLVPARLIIGPLGAPGRPAGLVALGLLLWWVAARLVPSLGVNRRRQPLHVALGFFSAAIVLSYVVAVATRQLPADQLTGADRGLLSMAAWVGVACVAMDMIRRVESIERLVRVIVGLGAVVAAVGIVQFATGADIAQALRIPGLTPNAGLAFISERSEFRRVAGTASHPIELGMVLALCVPLALHLAFNATRDRLRWWAAATLILVAVPMTLSRSAILGLAAGFLVLLPGWSGRRRAAFALVAPVFLVAMRSLIPGLLGTITSLFLHLGVDPSIKGRTEDYGSISEHIASSPWFGRGFATFLPSDFFILDNQYLGSLVETGIVGLAALLLLLVVGFTSARAARRHATDPMTRDLAQSLAACVAVAGVGMATFDGFGFPFFAGLFFLLLGCIGALRRLVVDEHQPAPDPVASPRWELAASS